MKIITKKDAKKDLLQIKWYIEKDSKFYANKTVNEINKRIKNLLLFPEMGKVVNKRESIIYKSYKILYKFDSKNIYILHIIHHSRNILNLKF